MSPKIKAPTTQYVCSSCGFTAPKCLCYSDMSHLYAHGPDMHYDLTGPL